MTHARALTSTQEVKYLRCVLEDSPPSPEGESSALTADSMRDSILNGGIIRTALTLGWPVMLSNVFEMVYNLTDAFWLGKLGPEAVAAPPPGKNQNRLAASSTTTNCSSKVTNNVIRAVRSAHDLFHNERHPGFTSIQQRKRRSLN